MIPLHQVNGQMIVVLLRRETQDTQLANNGDDDAHVSQIKMRQSIDIAPDNVAVLWDLTEEKQKNTTPNQSFIPMCILLLFRKKL